VEIEATGEQVIARRTNSLFGNSPMLAICFDEVSASSDTCELLEQQAALATAAEAEFADQLLVPGFGLGRAGNMRQQFAIRHRSRVEQSPWSGVSPLQTSCASSALGRFDGKPSKRDTRCAKAWAVHLRRMEIPARRKTYS